MIAMFCKSFKLMILSSVLAALSASASAVQFNDNFNVNQTSVSNYGLGVVDGPSQASVLGSTRRLSVVNLLNDAPGDARSRIAVSAGNLKFSNDVEVQSNGYVTYDWTTPEDLSGSGTLNFSFLSNDIAGHLTVNLLDVNHIASSNTVVLPASLSPFGVSVSGLFNGGIDRTKIIGLAFVFQGNDKGQDLLLDDVQSAVPEPASMAALGIGAVALLRRRRSK